MLSLLWSDSFWLPANSSWDALKSGESVSYPQADDLKYSVYFGVVLILVRLIWESLILIPLGHVLGISHSKKTLAEQIRIHAQYTFFASEKSKRKRVLECFWLLLMYTFLSAFGWYVTWNKPWLTEVTACWKDWPRHPITADLWWFYMVETAFYWSLLLSSAFDVKRSDFRELVIHHVVTIGLLWLSWTINMVRVGTLVLLSHDISDILLAAGKLFRHGRTWVKTTNVLFVLFLISWILLRLGYFPLVVLRTALLDAPTFIQPSYRWQNIFQRPFVPRIILAMLLCLQVLHLFWTFLIARTVVKTVTAGQAEDVRSDSEDDDRTESKKD